MPDLSAVEDKVKAAMDWLRRVNQFVVPFRLLAVMDWIESYYGDPETMGQFMFNGDLRANNAHEPDR
jgi:hypothetical protein